MRVLVTGKDGQLARSLAERGADRSLLFVGRPELDLADAAGIEAVVDRVRPDVIVNAAAYTAVDRAEDEPDLATAVNGVAPGVLARAARRCDARMIQISTDYVFEGRLDRPYREDDPVAPIGVYGRSKLMGEQAVAASGVTYATLRTAWVYGPYGANFVKTMLRLAATRDELGVVADQRGSPTSSLDLADAVLRLVETWRDRKDRGAEGVFHVAGGGSVSWADFARTVFRESVARGGPAATVRDLATAEYPTRAARPANSVLDGARFEAAVGWTMPAWTASLPGVVARLVRPDAGAPAQPSSAIQNVAP